jgi:hypothetical protein
MGGRSGKARPGRPRPPLDTPPAPARGFLADAFRAVEQQLLKTARQRIPVTLSVDDQTSWAERFMRAHDLVRRHLREHCCHNPLLTAKTETRWVWRCTWCGIRMERPRTPGWEAAMARNKLYRGLGVAAGALVLALLCCAAPAAAQAPQAPDPLAAETFASAYLWKEKLWSSSSDPADRWGGRVVGQVGLGRWGLALRGDVGGLPDTFNLQDPATFQALQIYVAVHRNLAGFAPKDPTTYGVALGVTAIAGTVLDLEGDDPTSPPLRGRFTAGAGLRMAGWDSRGNAAVGYLAVGTFEALGGLCVFGTVHLPLTSRLTFMGDAAVSRDGHAYARLAMGVTLAEGGLQ